MPFPDNLGCIPLPFQQLRESGLRFLDPVILTSVRARDWPARQSGKDNAPSAGRPEKARSSAWRRRSWSCGRPPPPCGRYAGSRILAGRNRTDLPNPDRPQRGSPGSGRSGGAAASGDPQARTSGRSVIEIRKVRIGSKGVRWLFFQSSEKCYFLKSPSTASFQVSAPSGDRSKERQ